MRLPILSVPEENACGCLGRSETGKAGCQCSTTGLVQILGRKYALRLLFLIGEFKSMRFGDLRTEMDDMSSSTLTIRLAELEGAGLIRRQISTETPPRVEYSLTQEGEDMRKSIFALSRFASRK